MTPSRSLLDILDQPLTQTLSEIIDSPNSVPKVRELAREAFSMINVATLGDNPENASECVV